MSKFFKSLLLLLSAGLFTATSWAAEVTDTYTFTNANTAPTLSPEGGWTYGSTTNADGTALGFKGGSVANGSVIAPDINVQTVGPWTITFNAPTGGVEKVKSISFGVVMYNNSGSAQDSGTKRNVAFTLYKDGDATACGASEELELESDGQISTATNGNVTITFAEPIDIATSLSIKATSSQSTGCFFGLNSFGVTREVENAGSMVTVINPVPSASFTDFSSIETGTTTEATTLTVNGIKWVLPAGVTKNDDGMINLNAVGSEIQFPAAQDHISIVLDLAAAPTVSGAILDYGKISLYYTANSELKALWQGGEWGTATAWTWSEANTKVMLAMAKANTDGTTYAADGITALTQADLRATGDTYTNAYIGCCDGNTKYANLKIRGVYVYSNSKLTEMPTFTEVSTYERTINGSEDWAIADWGVEGVTQPEASVVLNVTGESILTMNEASATLNYLDIEGDGTLTISSGETTNQLTADTTTINADTTVNAGAASLGAVTVASETTLTVKDNATVDSVVGSGTLNLDVGESTTLENYALNTFSGTTKISSGTLKYTGGANRPAGAILVSGENAALQIATSTDILGYSGGLPGITIENGARFEAFRRDTFSRVLTLNNGKLVFGADDQDSGRSIDFYSNSKLVSSGNSTIGGKDATNDQESGDPIVASGIIAIRRNNLEIEVADGTLSVYSAISTSDGADGSVYKKGAGTLALYRAATSALPVIVEAGELRLVRKGSLTTGAMTIDANATLTYVGTQTPTNAITNNGTITADGNGTEVDLTSTPISGSGTYAVTNGATLILPAGTENGASVTNGTLKLLLSPGQLATGYEANVAGGTEVTFVKAGAEDYEEVTEGVENGTYEPAMIVWQNNAGDAAWDNANNWSSQSIPSETANVEIQIAEDTELVLTGDVTVAALRVTGTDTLSITGGKLTASFIDAQANISADETKLALAPMNIAEGKTVTYTTTTTLADPDDMGASSHALSLKAMTGAGTFVKRGVGVIGLFATDAEPAIDVQQGAIYVRDVPTTAMNIAAKAGAEIRLAAWSCDFNNNANSLKLEGGAQLTLANGSGLAGTITIAEAAGTPAKICGMSFGAATVSAAITGAGKVEFANDGAFGTNKYPCDNATTYSGVISGALQVIISDAQPVTFSGANTYTGGTEIVTGAQLINDNGSALGTGKVTGAGTLIVNIGKHPGNHDEFGFAEAGWQGTVEFTGGNFATAVEFAKWQNANSKFKVASGATISAANSVAGTLMGGGTINNTLTFADGATLDRTAGTLTANTLTDLPAALTVKIENALDVGKTLDILTTTATPNTDATTVTVKVGDGDIPAEGTYSLVATGSALQLVREEDAPVEPNVDTLVTADNTGVIELGDDDGGKYYGVQVNLDVVAPYGPGWDAERVYVLESISIADRSTTAQISDGTTITVYDVTSGTATATQVGPEGSGTLVDRTSVTFTDKNASTVTTNWANFEFNTPILLDASKTYQFRFSAEASLYMIQVDDIAGATAEQMDAVIALNNNWGDPSPNFSPIVKLTATRKAVPNVSYVTDANTFSEKGNAGEGGTGSATLSGDWALTASSAEFQTSGAVGGTATILTPHVNVGNGETWTLTFAPQDGEPRVVDSLSMGVVMFNSSGVAQTSNVQNCPLTLTVTDGTTELASYSGLLTGNGTVNPVVTATLNFAPTKVTQLQVTAKRTDSTSQGCFYGISSFNVGTYEGATEVIKGNIPVEKGNVSDKNTSPMTKTDDSVWSVVSCKQLSTNADLGMKTGGTVGDDATIITPNVNVSSATSTAEGWALRYEADAPRKVDSVTVTIQMFNGGGNVQNNDNYTRAFKMTLKDVNGNELATTGDRTLQAVSGGTSRYPITLQIEPTELDTIVVEVSKGTADQEATGCFYGVSSFEVQLSQETTVLVNPTAWSSADMKLGAVYVGTDANLPAAPATQGGIYKADVFRSLNAGALENWTIDAATENQTMMTFTQNASVTMACPEAPEALRPSTQAMSVHFDDTPYFGKLGIDYMPFTTATDVAILYVDSDDEIAYNSNEWWTSATEGAAATQGALGDKTPMLWLEGGKVVMTAGADAKPMTIHNETTIGTIEIPAGVALAYDVTGEPSVSSPSIPGNVVVELGGALTMAGTLESVKLIGKSATLSGVNADNGDLTVTSIDTTEGTDLTIAGGNVMLTNPPAALSVNLNGGNLAVTASADTTATLAKLTVTQNANLTGDISVAQLGGTARLTSEDTLTVTGETTFGGSLEIGILQVNADASFTLSGATDSTVSSLSGDGTLMLNNTNVNKVAHLVLTGASDYNGAICLDGNTELKLSGVEQTGATLNVLGSLQLNGAAARLNTLDAGFSDALVKIASEATLITGGASGRQNANVEMADGAVLDVRNQSLSVSGFKLASETAVIEVIAGETGALLSANKGVDALTETNFLLSAESPILSESVTGEMLHFYVMPGFKQVALVQVEAELDGLSEADKQAIFRTVYIQETPVREITNRDVPAIFDAYYGSGYSMTTTPVTEDGVEKMDVAYAVNFGISEITAHKDAEDNILFNITAKVEPYQTGEAIAFRQNVKVDLLKGNEVVATQTIDTAGVSVVCFEDVSLLPAEAGTVTLTVRATSVSE